MKRTYRVHKPYKIVANEDAGTDVDTVATFVDRCKNALDKMFGDTPSIGSDALPTTIDGIEIDLDGQKLRFEQGENVAYRQIAQIDDEIYLVAGVDLVPATSVEETGDDTNRQLATESLDKWKSAIARTRETNANQQYRVIEDEPAYEMYRIIDDIDDETVVGMEDYPIASETMYEIVEDIATESAETPMRYQVVSGTPANESAPAVETYEIVPDVSEIGATESIDELLTEYQAVTKMKDTEFSGITAIESMPNVYKHLWHSLSKPGKLVVARKAKEVSANESEILKFWSNIDFLAVEKAVLATSSDAKLEIGVESVKQTQALNRKIAFLKNKL